VDVNGTIADVYEDGVVSGQTLDTSGFTAVSGNVGYGTLISTTTATLAGQTIELRNSYVLEADKSFVRITTRITNASGSPLTNLRVWVGTRDDWVGTTDTPTKTRGNLDANGFVQLSNPATRAAAIQITSGQQGVLFYSTSPKAHTSTNECCSFESAYGQDPATAEIELTNDGSYALFIRMSDLAPGAHEEFTWYYAAGAIAELGSIVGDLAQEAAVGINVTSSASAGGSVSPPSTSVTDGATVGFTVTPDANYRIDNVTGCDGSLSGNTYTTGPISAPCNVSATFALNTYQVAATAGTGGSIVPSAATVTHGQTTTFTVTPGDSYIIDTVSGCDGSLHGNSYTTGAITGGCSVNATFRPLHSVTVPTVTGGTIAPTNTLIASGGSATFTLTPDVGYSIGGVTGCGGQLSGNTYAVSNVSSACIVTVSFVRTPPTFQVASPALYEMSSVELLTALPAAARPTAVDFQGTAVSVEPVDNAARFAPGLHTLRWRAVDSRGAVQTLDQTLHVWPTVSLGPDLTVGARAGNFGSFRIALNGRAPVYPLTVGYSVSGDAQGTTLESGQVVFENNQVEKEIPFTVQTTSATGSPERTVLIELDERLNRGSNRPLRVTLTSVNQPPRVSLALAQAGAVTRLASRNDGPLTFSATIEDPDSKDTHIVEWRAPAGAVYTVSGDSIIVTPSSLTPGVHRFEVIVTDNGSPPSVTRRAFEVVVVESVRALPAGVTRLLPNGLPDSPAYAPVAPNVLPERGGELSHFLMEADPGTRLSLGAYAMYHGEYQTELPDRGSSLRIADDSVVNAGGYFDFVVADLQRAGDSVNVVIPQRAPIPLQPVYRKYDSSLNQWRTFVEDDDNRLASAPGAEGFCPPPSSSEFRAGLNAGDWCVRLTIEDGGPNDSDGAVNAAVSDPGGVGALSNVQVSGQSGGGSFDLLTLVGGLLLLLLLKLRRMLVAVWALLALVGSQARADDASSWYVGAQFGSARSYVTATRIDAALADQGYNVSSNVSNKSREAWRVLGGYRPLRWLAIEAGYSDLGEVDVDFRGPTADIGQFLINANALQPPSAEGYDVSAVARLPIGSRASAHVRAGAFIWDARYRTRNIDGQAVRRNDNGTDGLAAVGVQAMISAHWGLGAEFTRYGIDGDHIDFAGVGVVFRW
jgi:hypothetical protein